MVPLLFKNVFFLNNLNSLKIASCPRFPLQVPKKSMTSLLKVARALLNGGRTVEILLLDNSVVYYLGMLFFTELVLVWLILFNSKVNSGVLIETTLIYDKLEALFPIYIINLLDKSPTY